MHSTCCKINRKFKITGCKKRLHDFTSDLLRTMHPRPRHQPRPSTLSSFKSSYSHKALTMVCHACTESKILNTLQNVDSRSNSMKMKVAKCLSSLIEKLGTRVASFKDNNRLIKMVLTLLNESAQETR